MPTTGPGAWIAGQGGIGSLGGPVAFSSSSSGRPPVQGGAGTSTVVASGSASPSAAPPVPVVTALSVAATVRPGLLAPGLPVASATSSESGSTDVHPNIPALQRECDLARGRFSAASVEIEHLRESLRAVQVARGAAEEEVRVARCAAADAQPRAFGEFCS